MESTATDEGGSERGALVERYHELTSGRFDRPEELLTEDVVLHEGHHDNERRGREAVVEGFQQLPVSFPDFGVDIHAVLIDGDLAVSRHTTTGTFEREFDGIEPTGERLELEVMTMFRFEGDQIAEIWDAYDTQRVAGDMGTGETA